ncbi:winged helix-turn-helix domain-containing protein [Streptosporangiaceae bacterium NEAU-GS5]|nr:winged helix-turn-helix domain-containing protein [Streptosporangiaceae bacterium NEAU-GS5]
MFFGVLGPIAVWTADGEPIPVPGRKVRTLLAVLLAHEGRAVPAARLIDALWGERLPGDPAGTLSGKVTELRRALDRAEPGGRRLVVSPPPGYRLRVDADAVDAGRFRALVARARGTADPRVRAGLLSGALALWRGPAFADVADEPFARAAALGLTEDRLAVLEDHAEVRLALGEHTALVAELAELLAAYPLRERLRAVQMQALYRSGRPSEALASFEELRGRLANELGLDPGPDLVALHRAVLARDPRLDAAVQVSAVRPRTNLPASVSELIGRDEAVAAVRARLASDRLLTLTGPGGVGKTRLALEATRGLVDDAAEFPDGVWLAELGALERGSAGRPGDVVMAVLDIRDMPGAADRLVDVLRARRLLLVLDNCEHVVEQAAELAGRLLRGCPDVRVLATSREPLGLPGEAVWPVPPLEVPDPAAEPDPAGLAEASAVRLFAARAAAAAPGFALDADNAPVVAMLCRRLDGLPLALELAATRVRALGVHELVARLDDRFRLLDVGRRDVPARQRTLTAVIDWSWDLLTDPERAVLRRLAAHADGSTLEAAEHVCSTPSQTEPSSRGRTRSESEPPGGAGIPGRVGPSGARDLSGEVGPPGGTSLLGAVGSSGEPGPPGRVGPSGGAGIPGRVGPSGARDLSGEVGPTGATGSSGAVASGDVAGLLARLVDRSLVAVADGIGGPRYRLLESVAAYCAVRLSEAGESDSVRESHGRYYTELAARAEEGLYGHDQRHWLRRLDAESANMRGALDTAVREGSVERALRLVCALTWYWFLRGRLSEARRSLHAALAMEGEAPAGLRAQAAAWKSGIEVLLGEPDPAAGQVCEAVLDPAARARAEWFLAYAETDFGDVSAVDGRLGRALATFHELDDTWGIAAVLGTRAKLGYLRADQKAIERDGEQSAELFRELGDRWGLLQATSWLGGLAEMVGDHVKARRLHREGLRMAEELGLWSEVSVRLAWLGWIAVQQTDYAEARDLCGQALRLAGAQGYRVGETFAEVGAGFAARRQRDFDAAERHLTNLLATAGPEDGQAPPLYLSMVLTELGFLAEQHGQAAEARRLHLRALRISRRLGQPRGIAMALEGLAGAAGLAADHMTSGRLLGAADSARRAISVPAAPSEQAEIDRITSATRAALGEAAFTAAYQEGAGRTADEVTADLGD